MSIIDEDWQNLIVLDACRYDVFAEVVKKTPITGKLSFYDSGATCTDAWYRTHFDKDVAAVLVSASPMPWTEYTNHAHRRFTRAWMAWEGPEDYRPCTALGFFEWELRTKERTVLHMTAPHLPFIGQEGVALMQRLGLTSSDEIMTRRRDNVDRGTTDEGPPRLYNVVQGYGQAGHWDELRRCYSESVAEVLRVLVEYSDLFGAKTVITSDHGELIGEDELYGHTSDHDLLREVPWFEVESWS